MTGAAERGELCIRQMRTADIDAVLALETQCFAAPWTRTMFISELRAPGRIWRVVERDGALLGYGGAMIVGAEAHVMNLAVRTEERRGGIASALLVELADRARCAGARQLTLEVRETNQAARALYEAAGLHEVGVRPGYYSETREAAVIMSSDDMTHPGASARLDALREKAARALGTMPERECRGFDGCGEVEARTGEIAVADRGAELVLGIETSCDETAASVMRGGTMLLSSVVASQVDFHARFGGVVPEIASRKHTEAIVAVVDEALGRAGIAAPDLDAIAVTYGPGLVGALVVGVAYAKGLSFATGVPLVGVNHLEGHIFATRLAEPDVEPPLVALVVSGGHTSLVLVPAWGEYRTLGETLDDAAGEAFDKVAKVLGLGYPGGPVISKLAEEGDPAAIDLPRAMMHSGDYRFSLSGLKTAVITYIRHEQEAGRDVHVPNLAASFQQAVIDVQVAKALRAATEHGVKAVVLAGGVAANPALREGLRAALERKEIRLVVPSFGLCTDNAAMIAAAGTFRFRRGERLGLDAEAVPNLRLDTDM